jgi:UDP-N-acetyl-D-galactosamine dehydrogenase
VDKIILKKAYENSKIAIVGLGYVGLPLALEFSKKYNVLGFDINIARIEELRKGIDHTQEADINELNKALQRLNSISSNNIGLTLSSDKEELRKCAIFIVTVPTPIDKLKVPDLRYLIEVSEMLGSVIETGDLVIYESTVYPGCTEEDCIPVIERVSGLKYNIDFFAGYSPERISPGDQSRKLTHIRKVTSGSTPEIADRVDALYNSIIEAGTFKAASIKVAEASKVIENVQRNINISFFNELALICDLLGIDTHDVIDAASTKWNFIKLKPGLVGGHCIDVDPYYLAYKARSLGYDPQVILSGRKVNDQMGVFVANKVIKLMIRKEIEIKGARVLILGITFKENCPDIRNTRVVDIYHELLDFGVEADICDPWADAAEVSRQYGVAIYNRMDLDTDYNAVILAVAHQEFLEFDFKRVKSANGVIFDTKAFLQRNMVDGRL